MKRLIASKKVLLALFVFILCAISVPVFGQSAMPPDANNFLQVVGDTATGAIDRVNVVFFEIPDSEPGPFNFAIYDPGISGNYDQVIGGATTSTYHYLVGGTGTLQNPDSRKWFYYDTANEIDPDGDPDTYNGQPLTGNVLDQLTYAPTEDVDSGWVYFTSVYAIQGERIGNKLYFKVVTIVTAATDDKNGYRLDLSSDRNPVPSPIAGVRSFAYSLAIRHVPGGGTTWNLYPFVPDNRVNDYIIFSNNDMDNDGATGTAYDVSDTAQGTALGMSGNNDVENTSYQILLGEDNGFWTYSFGDFAASSNPNTAEIWTWIDSNPHNDSAAFDWALGIPDMPAANGSVRIYSAKFPITLPDYVTIDADDGVAISDGTDTERLVLQLVDAAGNPVLYERNIYVSLSGSGLIEAASNYISAPVLPQNSGTIQTDEFGMATIDISDNVVGTEIVTVTLTTDGVTGTPLSSNLSNATPNESAAVTFLDDIDPSLSSATNTTFDAGNAQVLPDITIADSGIANINDTDNIRIQIPAGLNAVFDPTASVTLTITGTGTGRVEGAGGLAWTGTLTYEDTNHRAVINVTTAFAVGDILTISGLAFTNANTGSTGSLTMSVNGAGGPYTITDDKVITIIGPAPTSFTWQGTVDSDWNNQLNWNPNTGVPDTATESAVIPNVVNDPSIPNGTSFTLDGLEIQANGELTLNGNTITVGGTFSNIGTLRLRGDETLTFTTGFDSDSGETEYWGPAGGTVFSFAGADYYDLEIAGTGTFNLAAAAVVRNNLTITSGTLDVTAAPFALAVGGDWTNNGAFEPRTGLVTFTALNANVTLTTGGTGGGKTFNDVVLNDGVNTRIFTLAGNLGTAGNLTITDGTLDVTATPYTITVGGNWTNTGVFNAQTGAVTLNGTGGLFSVNTGGVAAANQFWDITFNDGGVAATYQLTNGLYVNNDITITNGTLNANAQPITVIGNWVNNDTYTHGNNTVTFNGGAAQSVNPGGSAFFNVIKTGAGTLTLATNALTINNNLQIGAGAVFDMASVNFTVTGTFDNNAAGRLDLTGEQAIQNIGTMDIDSGTVRYYDGAGAGTIRLVDFFNLTIAGIAQTHSLNAVTDVNNNLTVASGIFTTANFNLTVDVDFIQSGGTVNAGSSQITVTQDFRQSNGTFNANTSVLIVSIDFNRTGGTFTADFGTVRFVNNGNISTIIGSTSFYNFECATNNKIIQFTNGTTTTILAGGSFDIQGTDNLNRVFLQNTGGNPVGAYGGGWVPAEQWRITITPSATADVDWVYIECSYSTNPIFPNEPTYNANDWCYNWRTDLNVLVSRTLDVNEDGRVDRIEVQVEFGTTLNDDFSDISVSITGYSGTVTFSTYQNTVVPAEANDDFFYIIFDDPGTTLNTGWIPDWQILTNNSLEALTGTNVLAGPLTTPFTPVDGAYPIVGYSLAASGGYQVFVHLSEPVYDTASPNPIIPGNISFAGNTPAIQQISANEYLLTFPVVITTAEIAGGALITYNNIFDLSGLQLLGAGPYTRQVSDLILALPGFEPVTFILYDNTPREPVQVGPGVGYISVFDGNGYIQLPTPLNTNLSWEWNIAGALTVSNVIWDSNSSTDYKNMEMWYPGIGGISQIYGLVSQYRTTATATAGSGGVNNVNFFTTYAELATGEQMCEFFIQFTNSVPNLLYARLARPAASDWYRSVRPFAFGVHSPGGQHGTVTIHNNVINPNNGEIAKLHVNVPRAGNVTIQVFSLAGDVIDVLSSGNRAAGEFAIYWDGRNTGGRVVARGLYFVKIVGPDIDEMRKIMVVK